MHLRITNNRHQHSMCPALISNPQVHLGSLTNTQGAPHNQRSILSSQNPCMHVHICNLPLMEVIMKSQSTPFLHGLCWHRLGRHETRFLYTSCWFRPA